MADSGSPPANRREAVDARFLMSTRRVSVSSSGHAGTRALTLSSQALAR